MKLNAQKVGRQNRKFSLYAFYVTAKLQALPYYSGFQIRDFHFTTLQTGFNIS